MVIPTQVSCLDEDEGVIMTNMWYRACKFLSSLSSLPTIATVFSNFSSSLNSLAQGDVNLS